MIPNAGVTCLFEFIAKFETLDGVYIVRATTTFADAVASGVDFFENLYSPAGLTREEYATDYAGYKKDKVCTIESVTDSNVVYYIPESIFGKVPDPTIREYYPLIMAVDLGIQKNPQVVLPLIDMVTDLIKDSLGSQNPVRIVSDPNKKIYLTDAQYTTVETARELNKQTVISTLVRLRQEEAKVTGLAAKVAAYEELLKSLGVTPN
jgi:hypothetical protein